MEDIYNNNEFIEEIKHNIKNNKFKDKQTLIDYLNKFQNDKDENLKKFKFDMLEYFDSTNKPQLIKPDDMKELKVENNNYIEYKDSENNTIVLEDNINKHSLNDQYNTIQNDLISNNEINNLNENEQIKNEMQKNKIEINMHKQSDVDESKLSNKEKNQLNAVKTTEDFKKNDYIIDTERNIYIDQNTNQTYKSKKNREGKYEVRNADNNEMIKEVTEEEKINNIVATEKTYNIESNNIPNTEIKKENKIDFSGQTDNDLMFLVSSGRLTEDQLIQVNEEINKRAQQNPQQLTNEKAKVFVKKYDGFSSLMALSLITGIGGMFIFLYILLMIG